MDIHGSDLGVSFLDLSNLSDDERFLKEEAHRVARDILRPAAWQLDKMSPEERILESSPFHKAMAELKSLGYHRMFLPAEYGGPQEPLSANAQAAVLEELGWGSLGLATSFLVDTLPFLSIAFFGSDELKESVLKPWVEDEQGKFKGCWAITEPDHGSDFLSLRQGGLDAPKGQLVAKAVDGGWLISGQKSAWVSYAPVATHGAIHVQE
ncbi:MAG: acyl-CoA/acyl-ACP dehydrogenase, partial [Acidimicrobiales bacterium]|nr:acyl-CoA/acyl-ACP dehydrogenase [Acidimicrobiales bacterium]